MPTSRPEKKRPTERQRDRETDRRAAHHDDRDRWNLAYAIGHFILHSQQRKASIWYAMPRHAWESSSECKTSRKADSKADRHGIAMAECVWALRCGSKAMPKTWNLTCTLKAGIRYYLSDRRGPSDSLNWVVQIAAIYLSLFVYVFGMLLVSCQLPLSRTPVWEA